MCSFEKYTILLQIEIIKYVKKLHYKTASLQHRELNQRK